MPTHVHPVPQIGRSLVPDVRKPFGTIRFLCRLLPSHEVGIGVVLWRDLHRRQRRLGGKGIRFALGLGPVLPGWMLAMGLIRGRRWIHNPSSTDCQLVLILL